MRKTAVFDFDGVIHSYKSGWKGITVIPDPPVDGIKHAIEVIRKKYRVVVFSSRCRTKEGMDAIRKWLAKHSIAVDDIVDHKPPAEVYVDDRAIQFDGNVNTLLHKIETFVPWYERLDIRKGVELPKGGARG